MREDIDKAFAHLRRLMEEVASAQPQNGVARMRAAMDEFGRTGPLPDLGGVSFRSLKIGGMNAEWVLAADSRPERRILHLHGGSLMAGSIAGYRPFMAELARRTGWSVLHVDYRLAPENRFPAAHDDALAAYRWMCANGPDGAGDAGLAVLSGDSIGSALAAATCAAIAEEGGRAADGILLLTPCLDCLGGPHRPDRDSDPVVSAAAISVLEAYADGLGLDDPRLSPARLPDAALARFPPCLIQASTAEYLLPDAQEMAARLVSQNRRVVLSLWPDMPHNWHHFIDLLPEATAAIDEVAAFLRANIR